MKLSGFFLIYALCVIFTQLFSAQQPPPYDDLSYYDKLLSSDEKVNQSHIQLQLHELSMMKRSPSKETIDEPEDLSDQLAAENACFDKLDSMSAEKIMPYDKKFKEFQDHVEKKVPDKNHPIHHAIGRYIDYFCINHFP